MFRSRNWIDQRNWNKPLFGENLVFVDRRVNVIVQQPLVYGGVIFAARVKAGSAHFE